MSSDDDTTDSPSITQRVHAATGDREAEAEALRRESGDEVEHDDAKIAVQRAHGEAGSDRPMADDEHPDEALAVPSDADAVHEERST